MLLHQIGGDKMYIDPLKDVRGVLTQTSANLKQTTNMALKPSFEIRTTFNNVFQQTRPVIKPFIFNNSSVFKLNIQINLTFQQFRNRLFSDEILNDFIKSTQFPRDEILKVNNRIRQTLIKSYRINTLPKPFKFAQPVNTTDETNGYEVFDNSFEHDFVTPFINFVKGLSKSSAYALGGHVLVKTSSNEYVDYFFSTSVIALLMSVFILLDILAKKLSNDE